jgi:hypothetical protein
LASLGVLFGFIHDRRYFVHFGVDVVDYTSYVDFLKAPFRIPSVFLWTILATFVATVDLWLVLSGRLKVGLPSLMTPLVVLYVVYVSIENAADSAARTLTPVTVELKSGGSGPPEAHGYLLIGRIGTTLFLCDKATGKAVLRESAEVASVVVDSRATNTGQTCWVR